MILEDRSIRRLSVYPDGSPRLEPLIAPFSEGVQGGGVISYGLTHAGYDLRLGDKLLVFKNTHNELINPKRFNDDQYRHRVFDEVEAGRWEARLGTGPYQAYHFVIPPHSYALGFSLEYLSLPNFLKGHCVGKSTLARCGILINTTPLEPGWHGHLTIEISNITPCPALVFAREGIAQLEFHTLTACPQSHYGDKAGKYQGQSAEPIPARTKE
jgi:dCTP deaminase